MKALFSMLICCLVAIGLAGCDSGGTKVENRAPGAPDQHDDHDHDDHDGDHVEVVHGPKGGHLFTFEGETGKSFEFTYTKDTDVIDVYVYYAASKTESPVTAESVTITQKIGDKQNTFELKAVEPVDGKASKFEVESPELKVAIFTGVELSVKDGDTELVGKIPAHERHEH